jgi:tRNA (guanine-N7-)-methyltransferase
MPLRHYDPFQSKAERLDPSVNPYVAVLTKEAHEGGLQIAYGEGLRGSAGHWRDKLPFTKLVCEIGVHKGMTLVEMARENPDVGFVGIDITYKRVVITAQRAQKAGLKNVFLMLANATALDLLFAPGELDGVVMFFPDPWVRKKSQAKNRLVDDAFCGKLATALAPQGFFWFKTDYEPYFASTESALAGAGFARLPEGEKFLLPRDYSSAFEKRFHEGGVATHAARWARMV